MKDKTISICRIYFILDWDIQPKKFKHPSELLKLHVNLFDGHIVDGFNIRFVDLRTSFIVPPTVDAGILLGCCVILLGINGVW